MPRSWILLALLAALPGCHGADQLLQPESPPTVQFFAGDAADLPAWPASVAEAHVVDDVLSLRVTYASCVPHVFALHASTGFLESDPPQALLYLSHESEPTPCLAFEGEDLLFDLAPLRHAAQGAYGPVGPILLRIFEPGRTEPVRPLPVYEF